MRLLEYKTTGEICLTEHLPNNKLPQYAILSHTWGDEEVLFKDLMEAKGKDKAGYAKIQFCGNRARKDGFRFFWVDTCCIDKSNSTELQEAINCMFRWYHDAAKCYVYLTDVSTLPSDANKKSSWEPAFRASRWFTRGWTLQELVAPASIEFFSREGVCLGDRGSLEQHIHDVTGIPLAALRGNPLADFSVADRMAWMEKRETTREEDKAYSLFGLFDVQVPLLYGEGAEKAFRRLREEITPSRKEKENEILRRLYASPYQDRKDINPDRVHGTCEWFVSHERFREWQESRSSRMLWVSADPGCGKSVLAKHLVDSVLLTTKSRTVCYFFFKDGFDDQTSVTGALCCILHQLFKQRRDLLSGAILDQLDTGGETIIRSFSELWQTLINAAKIESAGEIICLFDAVDECEGQGRSQLAKALCKLYGTMTNFDLKFLLTSRPYDEIRRSFQPLNTAELPMIRLSGESSAEISKISREISVFIEARAQDLGTRLRLTESERGILLRQLMCVPNRTYLWVHLTLDIIEKAFGVDGDKIVAITSQLPQTVDEAYDKILSKSGDSSMALKMLHIIVAAARPLTLAEMGLALALQKGHRSYNDLHLKPEDRLRDDVRGFCGLFVMIIDSRVYLLHQTAREFLVHDEHDEASSPQGAHGNLKWKYVLRPQESHCILAEICVWHLLLAEFETHPLDENGSLTQYAGDHIFLDYSAKNWATHFRELPAGTKKVMTESVLEICDTSSHRFRTWFRIYWTATNTAFPEGLTALMAASYFGLETAVECLHKKDGSDLDPRDGTYQRSALSWAAGNGFDVVVKLLTEGTGSGLGKLKRRFRRRDRVNSADRHGRTPLTYAVWSGNVATVELLIKAGAKAAVKDEIGGTPLSYAVCNGNERMVELLLRKNEQVASVDSIINELLFSAAGKGDEAGVELLLGTGRVDINAKDGVGWTPLSRAAERGHTTVVKMLLETGEVDVEAKDHDGRASLSHAAENGHTTTSRANVEATDRDGGTPLAWAIESDSEACIKMLLVKSSKIDYNYKPFVSEPLLCGSMLVDDVGFLWLL
ncbi:hypothetical protein B0T25DRAFT_176671 [Lasiosphaeria hispida]|uniref:Uncharacterized protein n=1 Tax=Lasiosphaeria hispida TaxID=260671 RepID=A0AAJ0HNM8_9PEZI|nr:hypothetical protein B0T25DRAFT_176671 [Lasiosphaeria hispida]